MWTSDPPATAAHDGPPPNEPGAEPAWQAAAPIALLGAATLLLAWSALGYVGDRTPLGDDASSHITAIATLASRMIAGEGWWSTDYNLGFALGLYYQPLPHIVSAAFTVLIGGPHMASFTWKLFTVLFLALQPWAIWFGLRRAGIPSLHAAVAGFLSLFLINSLGFGYTTHAALKVGLYTQTWGAVALPLALGEIVALAAGRGRLLTTALAAAFLAGTHMFYAITIVPVVLILVLVHPDRVRALLRLAVAGAGAAALLVWWLLPLATTQAFFGGWPFGRPDRGNGYGWDVTWDSLSTGTFLDGQGTPFLTIAALIGAIMLVRSATITRDRGAITALVLLAWTLFGNVGRDGELLSRAIDLYPLHDSVQLFRYSSFLQFALVVAAGYGVGELVRLLPGPQWRAVGLAGALGLCSAAAAQGWNQLQVGFRTVDDSPSFTPREWDEVASWIRELPDDGRVWIHKKTGTPGHYHSGLLAWAGDHPAGQSYGVGLHDSLHFYTLEFLDPMKAAHRPLLDLYDFRWILTAAGRNLTHIGATPLRQNARYTLWKTAGPDSAVAIMRIAGRSEGTPRAARADIRAWLNGNGPETGSTIALRITDPRDSSNLVGSPVRVDKRTDLPFTTPPAGTILEASHKADRLHAVVELPAPAVVVAKFGHHPFWRVRVDGAPVDATFVYPGFPAVEVGPGRHTIEAEYRWPAWAHALLLLIPVAIAGLFLTDRRRSRPTREAAPTTA